MNNNNMVLFVGVVIAITLIETAYADRYTDQYSLEKIKEKSKEHYEKSKENYEKSKPKGSSYGHQSGSKEKFKLPQKTEKFDEEIEKYLSDMYSVGDPDRPLAVEEKDMKNRMCRNHQKSDDKLKEYIKKKYSSSSATITANDAIIKAINKKNNDYCATKTSRKDYTDNAAEVNKNIKELAKARQNHINGILSSINDDDVTDIKLLCCSLWRYKNETLEAIENEDVKGFVVEMIVDYNVNAHTLICKNHNEDSDKCEFTNKKPKIDWKYSILSAGLYAVSKTSSFERR